jgi:hypothetical protein
MQRLYENGIPSIAPNPLNEDELLGRRIVLELVSTPSRCLFIHGASLTGSGTFALMRKLVDANCDELGVSDCVRASAQSYSTALLGEALDSLFKQRQ